MISQQQNFTSKPEPRQTWMLRPSFVYKPLRFTGRLAIFDYCAPHEGGRILSAVTSDECFGWYADFPLFRTGAEFSSMTEKPAYPVYHTWRPPASPECLKQLSSCVSAVLETTQPQDPCFLIDVNQVLLNVDLEVRCHVPLIGLADIILEYFNVWDDCVLRKLRAEYFAKIPDTYHAWFQVWDDGKSNHHRNFVV